MIKSGMLTYTDLRDNPERFFSAHRIGGSRACDIGPGFFIRFTV